MQDGRAHVNFPATSPYVLAVGGTTLHVRQAAKGVAKVTEVVWNDGPGSGTGGGVSDVTPVPVWQAGKVVPSINPGHFAGRAIPDVAADADPATGYLTMSGGKLKSSEERALPRLCGQASLRASTPPTGRERETSTPSSTRTSVQAAFFATSRSATTTPTACSAVSTRREPGGTPAPGGARPTVKNSSRRFRAPVRIKRLELRLCASLLGGTMRICRRRSEEREAFAKLLRAVSERMELTGDSRIG